MSPIESSGAHEAAPVLEHRNVFQAALMMHWHPDTPELANADENTRAMNWITRYAAAYANLYAKEGSELLVGSARNPQLLEKWQQKLEAEEVQKGLFD